MNARLEGGKQAGETDLEVVLHVIGGNSFYVSSKAVFRTCYTGSATEGIDGIKGTYWLTHI